MTKNEATARPELSERQSRSLMRALTAMLASEDGTISMYATIEAGVHQSDRSALVQKGYLIVEYRDFVMPTGPYAGQTYTEYPFYYAA